MVISGKYRKIIYDTWQDKRYVYLTGDGLDIRFQTRIIDVQDNHLVLNNSVTPQYLKQFLKSRNFYMQIFLLSFKADSIDTDGKNILISLKKTISFIESRHNIRREFFPHSKEFCQFINPLDNSTLLRKLLMDLSEDGFSLVSLVETKLFSLGLVLKDIEFFVDKKDKRMIRSAEVKHIKTLVDINGKRHTQVGFAFLK